MPETRGISFPFRQGTNGFPEPSEGRDSVEDSLRALVFTGVGERVMRPNLGTNSSAFVMENLTPITLARIGQSIKTAIETFEPRVTLLAVEPINSPIAGEILVTITYRVSDDVQQFQVPLRQ